MRDTKDKLLTKILTNLYMFIDQVLAFIIIPQV